MPVAAQQDGSKMDLTLITAHVPRSIACAASRARRSDEEPSVLRVGVDHFPFTSRGSTVSGRHLKRLCTRRVLKYVFMYSPSAVFVYPESGC